MKAIIVDDEPKAIQLIHQYTTHFSQIEVSGTFRNALKAFEFLSRNEVDLVFLDIQMPHLSGIAFSKMIPPETGVIFTTAYPDYAVESYDIQAVDYLLKPISLERFTRSISRFLYADKERSVPRQSLIIKSGHVMHRIQPGVILFLRKDGNYMEYHLDSRMIVARESIQEALSNLPSLFIQTHKSYIVNATKVNSLDRDGIRIENHVIPLSDSFKETFLQKLKEV